MGHPYPPISTSNPRQVASLEFDRCVLPHGVTTVLCDPHEISAERTIMDVRVNLFSFVPATSFKTAGAQLEADDLLPFRSQKYWALRK